MRDRMSKEIGEIELTEDMYEYTVKINGIKRAISKKSYNTLNNIIKSYPINQKPQIRTTCPNCFTKLTLQQPQLSEDVEEDIKYLRSKMIVDFKGNVIGIKQLDNIKQHIQAQASENKDLKQRCANFMKQLNAIREIFQPYEYDMDWIIEQMDEILGEHK